MDWKNHLEKNPIQKLKKTENQSEIAACEQKTIVNRSLKKERQLPNTIQIL